MADFIPLLIAGYILIMSIIGFVIMGIDKRRSVYKVWRISEKTLLLIAILGGGIGSCIGMHIFRHKTKHARFTIILPLAGIIYILLLLMLIKGPVFLSALI